MAAAVADVHPDVALVCAAAAAAAEPGSDTLAAQTVRPWLWKRTVLQRVIASLHHVVPDVRLVSAQLALALVKRNAPIELRRTELQRWRPDSPAPCTRDALLLLEQAARSPVPGEKAAPEVAIVICAFDEQEWIGFAVHSALVQTETRVEVIVVDDGSRDGTPAVVRAFADPRVSVISHRRNLGKAHALSTALAHVRCGWILELDADDWLEPTAVATLLAASRSARCEAPILWSGRCQIWRRRRSGLLFRGPLVSSRGAYVSDASARVPVPRFYATQDLRRFGGWETLDASGGRLYEDVAMTARYLRAGHIRVLDDCLYHRVIHGDSVSQRHPYGKGM